MFGCIAAGRPVQTNLTAISPTQFTFTLPYPPSTLNHLVIFLLPDVALPQGTAATVYINLDGATWKLLGAIGNDKMSAIFRVRGLGGGSSSGSNGSNGSNGNNGGSGSGTVMDQDQMVDDGGDGGGIAGVGDGAAGEVILGISIEPLSSVEAQLSTLSNIASSSSNTAKNTPFAASPLLAQSLVSIPKPAPIGTGAAGGTNQIQLPHPSVITVLARRIIKNAFNYLGSFSQKGPVPGGGDVVPLKAFQDWWVKFEKRVEYDPSFLERED